MKTKKLYNIMVFLLITIVANAQNKQVSGLSGKQEYSFYAARIVFEPEYKSGDGGGCSNIIHPVYTYDINRRWAKSTSSIKIRSRKINDVIDFRVSGHCEYRCDYYKLMQFIKLFPVQQKASQTPEHTYFGAMEKFKVAGEILKIYPVFETGSLNKIFTYPNPVLFYEYLTLQLPEKYVGGKMNIYNVSGTLIKSDIQLPTRTVELNIANLVSREGTYLFRIIGKSLEEQIVKIIVKLKVNYR